MSQVLVLVLGMSSPKLLSPSSKLQVLISSLCTASALNSRLDKASAYLLHEAAAVDFHFS